MALIDDGYAALADIRLALNAGDRIGLHLFLNSRPRRGQSPWLRISLSGELADRLADAARRSLWKIEADATDEQSLAEFNFDSMVEASVGVLSVRETPGLGSWLDELPQPDWPQRFEGDEETLSRSRFYAFRLSVPDGRLVRAFRGKAGLQIAAKKRNAVAAMFQRDTLELVPVEGSVITFDQDIDFFEWDGLMFVLNMRTFEAITNIREVTVSKAADAVDALAARFGIGDTARLKEHIGKRTRLAKRLASAHRYGLVAEIDPAQVDALIVQRKLQFACVEVEGRLNFELDLENARSVEDFVDLVADVFLVSPTTRRDWEALVKRPPRRR